MHIQENEPVLPSSESNPWRKLVTRRQLLSATGKGALAIGAGGALSGLVNSSAGATDRSAGLSAAAAGTSLDFGIEYTLIANQNSAKEDHYRPVREGPPKRLSS